MARPVTLLCLLSLLFCSVGCRMCPTPHDYSISGYVNRCDDYRGFNPVYRAGSIFSCNGCSTCQTSVENAYCVGGTGDFYNNAGSYGNTTPVTPIRRESGTFGTPRQREPIAIPLLAPETEGLTDPRRNDTDTDLPSIEELLRQPRGSSSDSIPLAPPVRPKTPPPRLEDVPTETIPFSPSDEVNVPQDPFPSTPDSNPPITLEELRRLDPSVRDIQIISIEDAAVEAAAR